MGKKEFFSLVVLDLTLLYLQPEGRSVLGVGRVLLGWSQLSCGHCGGRGSAERAVESW